ncbi:NBR1-Ig-like domain-containing protein [Amycolatopsis thailandensis]|uniref:NBR1-Ig-like domain-containing protein n=1 Tax=Amycolatopsis thailandensis TaxID=589330 RepID=UPI003652B8CC
MDTNARGSVPGAQAGERTPELEAFMDELRKLRTRAGEPSFRKMAAKSGAVSHATLHLTVTGRRLQPWETVREFVRACDGDEEEWHARWQGVQLVLSAERAPEPAPARSRWRSKRVLVPLALVLVAAIAAVVVVLLPGDEGTPEPPHPGDSSRFVADVTIPDDTVVKPGTQFVKVWELKNTGTVEWKKRYLRRTDLPVAPGACRTPDRIPVNDTAPQGNVQVTVTVGTPPTAPADCKVFWKMVDEQDRELFPGNRPIYFSVLVRS